MRTLLGVVGAALALLPGCGNTTASSSATVTSDAVSDQEIVLLVKGWRSAELATILSVFEGRYALEGGTLEIIETADGMSRIRLRQRMPASHVLFLINYLHYPESFDLKRRSPVAVAVVRLGPAFGITEPPLVGRTAAFYVPTDDTRYDEVYAALDDGSAFRVPFTNLGREPVAEARRSSTVEAIQKSAPAL